MSAKKHQLFRIMAAMQPTEKAYFKKFGYKQQAPNRVLLDLFGLVDARLKRQGPEEVDEEELVRAFAKKQPGKPYTKAISDSRL